MIVELKRWWRVVGFRFDAHAAFLMCQQFGVDLSDMDQIPKEEITPAWVWNAHRSYCIEKCQKPKYSFKRMKLFIEVMPKAEWDLLVDAMYKTRGPEGKAQKKK